MIETQLKQLIKSIDLLNETLINQSLGGQDVKPTTLSESRDEAIKPGAQLPVSVCQIQPASQAKQPTQAGPADLQNNPVGSQPPRTDPTSPMEGPAAVDPEIAATVAAAQSLQARIMSVSQATSNPMLGMQFLAQFKLTSFDELSSEQMEQTDKQLVEIAAAAGVKL